MSTLRVCVRRVSIARLEAQSSPFGAITPPGVTPGSGYNAFSGAFGVSIPLHRVSGRGEGGFDIVWNAQPNWAARQAPNGVVAVDPYPSQNIVYPQNSNAYGLGGPGWIYQRTSATYTNCNGSLRPGTTLTSIVFVAGNGAQMNLFDTATNGAYYSIPNACSAGSGPWNANRGTTFLANDGSNATFQSSAAVQDLNPDSWGTAVAKVSGVLTLSNGLSYTISNSLITQIEDRNGNQISMVYGGPSQYIDWGLFVPALTTVTDSLGRITSVNYSDSSCSGCLSVTYYGTGGAARKVEVLFGALDANLRSGAGYSLMSIGALFPGSGQPTSYNFDPQVATAVVNPDDGEYPVAPATNRYKLQYNSYAEVARITLPTGGAVEYDYGDGNNGSGGGYETGTGGAIIYRRLVETRNYPSGGTGSSYTSRAHNVFSTGTVTETVYDPNSKVWASTTHNFWGSPMDAVSGSSGCTPYEGLESQTLMGSPTIETIYSAYFTSGQTVAGCAAYPQLTNRTVMMNDSGSVLIMQTAYQYDAYGNVTDRKDYDWGTGSNPGSLLRETKLTYLGGGSYTNANLVRLPATVAVLDGAGNSYSYTILNYDEYSYRPLQGTPGIIGHDAGYGSSYYPRGNVTTVWKSQTGAANVNIIGAQNTFDIAGNLVLQTDGKGNSTTLSYNDDGSNKYVFPTTIKNALGQTTSPRYDYNIGQPTSILDANGKLTSLTYAGGVSGGDKADRLSQIKLPTGALINYSYQNLLWNVVQRDQNAVGDQALQNQTVSDGFGRLIEKRILEGGSTGTLIATDYGYDAMGRLVSASNPSRITMSNWNGDGLGYITVYAYDSLGRPTIIQAPDQGSTTFLYSGTATGRSTVVSDAAGKLKANITDGLGRLTQVVEDASNGGANLPTNYTYDPLGDLLTVQKCAATNCGSSQLRSFVYDGLGRLTKATNPEQSGATNYTYDADNNLLTRSDALGITTTYSYDALNRLTGKSYNDNATPSVAYAWDVSGVANGVGRLGSVSNSYAVRNYLAYDAVGNVTSSQVQNSLNGYTYNFNNYTYDLAGSLTSETYPSGRVLTTVYDGAERPVTLTGTPTGGAATTYVKPISTYPEYWPHGAPYVYQYANNIDPVNTFDSVLRPAGSWATLNNNGNNWYVILGNSWNTNGTLAKTSEGYGPNVLWSNMNWFTQNYNYDSLNRLTSAGDGGWSQSFSYDAYGNRSITAGLQLSGLEPRSQNGYNPYNPANNQLLEGTYDANGQMKSLGGAVGFTYDAEGRTVSSTSSGSPSVTVRYYYDGEGNRIQKSVVGGTATTYVHDAFGVLAAEYSSTAITPACVTCYLVYDHLGSVRLVTDQASNVVARHDYVPYGQEIPNGTGGRSGNGFGVTGNVNQMFTGQERDPEMTPNTDFFNARYFSAVAGSFLRPDPGNAGASLSNPQSWNGYAYVSGNPMSSVDPSGMGPITISNLQDCISNLGACATQAPGLYGYYVDAQMWNASQNDILGAFDPFRVIGQPAYTPPFSIKSGQSWQTSVTIIGGDTTIYDPHLDLTSFFVGAQWSVGVGGIDVSAPGSGAPGGSHTCTAVSFKITGIAPNQAPGITSITNTPRGDITDGGVAIKPQNFGVKRMRGSSRAALAGVRLTVDWASATGGPPDGIPTLGPYFPVDVLGPASVRNAPGNQIDVYNYSSYPQAFASTRSAMVTAVIPASGGLTCPK